MLLIYLNLLFIMIVSLLYKVLYFFILLKYKKVIIRYVIYVYSIFFYIVIYIFYKIININRNYLYIKYDKIKLVFFVCF